MKRLLVTLPSNVIGVRQTNPPKDSYENLAPQRGDDSEVGRN